MRKISIKTDVIFLQQCFEIENTAIHMERID